MERNEDFEAYVDARRTPLVRAIVLLGCPQPDAEDLVQAVLMRCYRSWGQVADSANPDAHVHKLLVKALDDARQRRWGGELPTPVLPVPPPFAEGDLIEGLDVRRALIAMSTERREVLVLRHYAELSVAETADMLDASPETVQRRTADALRELDPGQGQQPAIAEEAAHHLLGQASRTIDVGAAPMPVPPARNRSVLAGAAVLLVAIVALVLVFDSNSSGEKTHRPDGGRRGSAAVPSVFGMRVDAARKVLERDGFKVSVQTTFVCESPDRVAATEPGVGATVPVGGRVRLLAPLPQPTQKCASIADREYAWRLLDFARGIGDAPPFADHVDLYLRDGSHRVLTAAEAARPENWSFVCHDSPVVSSLHSCPISALRYLVLAADPRRERTGYSDPLLKASSGLAPRAATFPAPLRGRTSLNISILPPEQIADGRGRASLPSVVSVFRVPRTFGIDGSIDAVLLDDGES